MPLDHPAPPEREQNDLEQIIDAIERRAFDIPPMNVYTPDIVGWCIAARSALHREREKAADFRAFAAETIDGLGKSMGYQDDDPEPDPHLIDHMAMHAMSLVADLSTAVADRDREREEKRQAALDYLALEGQMREVVAERDRYRAAAVDLLAALEAKVALSHKSQPRKLEEALTWRDNDERVHGMATSAIAKAESALAPAAQESKGE